MPTAAELRAKYFVNGNDPLGPAEPVPHTFADCGVVHLIDGLSLNTYLDSVLGHIGQGATLADNRNDFIFIAGWWLGLLGGEVTRPGLFDSTGLVADETQIKISTIPYNLGGIGGPQNKQLLGILKDKASVGVDVRVLGWVSPTIVDSKLAQMMGAGNVADVNANTMNSIKALRDVEPPQLPPKAMLNVLSHPAGAVHMKMILLGNSSNVIGLTGGVDLVMNRADSQAHDLSFTWHDVMVAVSGPAVQALFHTFREMWNLNLSRGVQTFRFEGEDLPSFTDETPAFPPYPAGVDLPTLPLRPTQEKVNIQTLQTIPGNNFAATNCLGSRGPVPFAPDGRFQVRVAWRKAILAAERYIYMEDQFFWSREVMSWINAAVKRRPELKVILLIGGAGDPNDAPHDDRAVLHESINLGLLGGLNDAQKAQIKLFRLWGDNQPLESDGKNDLTPFEIRNVTELDATRLRCETDLYAASLPANLYAVIPHFFLRYAGVNGRNEELEVVGNEAVTADDGGLVTMILEKRAGAPTPTGIGSLVKTVGILVHTKTTIIDDEWALVGSANCARRSLYTDWEHALAFFDEDGVAVKEYRKSLWAEHFHRTAAEVDDLDGALRAWESSWGTVTPHPTVAPRDPGRLGPPYVEAATLPLEEVLMSDLERARLDAYRDVDARQPWGGLCPPGLVAFDGDIDPI